jgi:hypothetical protein
MAFKGGQQPWRLRCPWNASVNSLLARPALRAALAASTACALAALAGAAVRVLPWLLDPAVTLRVAAPFARSIAALALEASLLVGWPVGWAVSAVGVVERGEGRVLATLGERPGRTAMRLVPQALAWSLLLGGVSFLGGRDASAPGRVVDELLEQARASCDEVSRDDPRDPESTASERAVPFANATWLCAPGQPPRLAGRGPGALRGVFFTASGAHVTGDLRRLELSDAKLVVGPVHLAVGALRLRGLTPWAHGSNLAPAARAVLLALTGATAALLATYLALRGRVRLRLVAVVVGAAGPLAALAWLRALERTDARAGWSAAVLPLALLLTVASAGILSRLPRRSVTASK